jgi:hypothetical protein
VVLAGDTAGENALIRPDATGIVWRQGDSIRARWVRREGTGGPADPAKVDVCVIAEKRC